MFYKELIGSASDSLVGIDVDIARKGKQFSPGAAQALVLPITNDEIGMALKGINVHKAHGLYGFNIYFFKKAWEIVKNDIYAAVQEFFAIGKLLRHVNNTSVTLIPKVQNATVLRTSDLLLDVLLFTS